MADRIHTFQTPMMERGRRWIAEAWGEEREGGRWDGWIVFIPTEGGRSLPTARETTQSTRAALAYWASGLEEIYLDGAFTRAASQAA